MASKGGRLGYVWERALELLLKDRGWDATYRPRAGAQEDRGDFLGGPKGWTLEAKNAGTISLPRFMREAKSEADNNGHEYFAVLIKSRRGKGGWPATGRAQDGYAVMPIDMFLTIVARLENTG